jgi:hypothetical protein
MLYGNKESGPLHLKITVKKRGAVFVCQPPGVWGRLPDGFKWCVAVPWPKFLSLRLTHLLACLPPPLNRFWEADAKIYLTENIAADTATAKTPGGAAFTFDQQKAVAVPYTNHRPKDTQNICVDTNGEIPEGTHALTIVPQTADKIMISTILLP